MNQLLSFLYTAIRGVTSGRILGRSSVGTGRAELLDAAAVRSLAVVYSTDQVDAGLATKAAAVHSHAIADTTGLQAALDAKLSAAVTSINSLTGASQTITVGTSGIDFAVSSSGSTHTLNLPDASATARGVVTTGTQAIAGAKTFSSPVSITSGGTAINLSGSNPTLNFGSSYGSIGGTAGGQVSFRATGGTLPGIIVGNPQGGVATNGIMVIGNLHPTYMDDLVINSGSTYADGQTAGSLHLRGGHNFTGGTNSHGGKVYVYGGAGSGTGTTGNVHLCYTGSTAQGRVLVGTATDDGVSRLQVAGALTITGAWNLAPITKAALLALTPTAASAGRWRVTDATPANREAYPDGTNWRYTSDDTIVV